MRQLKRIRVVAAFLVLIPLSLALLDFGDFVPARLTGFLARLQFVPALMRSAELAAALIPVAFIIVVTLLWGRLYCSTLCPLGTLQDMVIRLSTTRRRRRRFRFSRSSWRVHAGVFVAMLVLLLAEVMWPLSLLEPYSNFSRVVSQVGRPLLASVRNGVAQLLSQWHIYAITPVEMPRLTSVLVALAAVWLMGIVVLSYAKGRAFCNLLCPTGLLLRLLARVSLFKIVIGEHGCTGCGLCEKVCKARCIDSGNKAVDFAACVGCFNCLAACPASAMHYTATHRRKTQSPAHTPPANVDTTRRQVLAGAALLATSAAFPHAALATSKRQPSTPVMPPGASERDHFTGHCTACYLCVSACPSQVLRPSLLAYGWGSLMQPRMVYESAACIYDCHACTEVCPTGALLPLSLDDKRLTQIGRARFVKDDCIVVKNKTMCGACTEHCPTGAVHMVPFENGLSLPYVSDELCIGCGACEHPCPAQPDKAIFVEGLSPHKVASKPVIKKPEMKQQGHGVASPDFPF